MSDKTYNGWTNYATWRINLEVLGDEGDSYDAGQFESVDALADYLEDYLDEVLTGFGQVQEGLALDYARSFVSDVNYHEIAERMAEDYPHIIKGNEEEK
jgi:hypothetical protein